jgi:putative oxidoreductase
MNEMLRTRFDDFGKLAIRLSVGGLMLLHGIAKIQSGVGGLEKMFADAGLPGAVAYAVYLGEVVGPILLILGCYARIGGMLVAATMAVAVAMAHRADVFVLDPQSGASKIELQLLYFCGALAIVFLGAGRIGLTSLRRKTV